MNEYRGRINTIEKILHRIIIMNPSILDTGCWIWSGCTRKGYGVVGMDSQSYQVHKLIFEHFCGPVPLGKELHHRYKTKQCCNFEHLSVLTRKEHHNLDDRFNLGQFNAVKTHCPKGHPYDEVNTGLGAKPGWRTCKACKRECDMRRYWNRKQDKSRT